ncbi:hypothetical protein LR003_02965, partial [candidate division NPL-UPA2 bacterium]|nr:hypothetical protein [candidate division NPL-UPA2 bacterium]
AWFSALRSGRRGRRFESARPDLKNRGDKGTKEQRHKELELELELSIKKQCFLMLCLYASAPMCLFAPKVR